jgi:zinc D-Ala-D-Ala carboxypeptidase
MCRERARLLANTPQNYGISRTLVGALVGALVITLAACGSPRPTPPPGPATPPEPLVIGTAATDTVGGWLPDGKMLSPFDVSHPVIAWLDPLLLKVIQDAARRAASDGIDMKITSGWRSKGFQQRLFDDAVRQFGSVDLAKRYVTSPEVSKHVDGEAVDIAPADADRWLIRNGSEFGLCQIYANEIWHFELVADEQGNCPPLKPNAAG